MESTQPFQILTDTSELKITCEGPQSGRAVVSFTGIGHALGSIQKEEFVKSLHNLHAENAAFYVTDKQRSWYNATHEAIRSTLSSALEPFQEVVTLGNSMGGFGAIYFAGLLPACRAAIAFCPQFSLAPGRLTPRDNRWMNFRTPITSWPVSHALEHASEAISYYLFFGADDRRDRRHARCFLYPPLGHAPAGMHVFLINRCGHDVAAFLKSRGALRPLLDGILHRNFGVGEIGRLFKDRRVGFHRNAIPFSFRALWG